MSEASLRGPKLGPLVSQLAASWALEEPDRPHRRFDASLLSADISGFTPLTERLAEGGREGAERLTIVVNAAFSGLIEAAERYGGDITSFGGDAIFVVFRGDDHGHRASQAAMQMQQAMEHTQRRQQLPLSMTIGVDSGPLDAFLVGTELKQLVLAGPTISSTLALESAADDGEVLIGPNVLTPRRSSEGPAGAISLYRPPPEHPPLRVEPGPEARRLVPQELADQLAAVETIRGEHRMASMGFLLFSGLDRRIRRDPTGLAVDLTRLIDTLRRLSAVYGVSLLQCDVWGDGGKLLLSAGVPVSIGNDEEAVIRTLTEIIELDVGLELRGGVQRGWVFAGFTGNEHRRTYTVMGDGVNTAARLLGRAEPGRVLATTEALDQVTAPLRLDPVQPFLVKGKSVPLEAANVDHIGRTSVAFETGGGPDLVGREAELALFTRLLADARRGSGAVLDISGDAGIGKSRLVQAGLESAEGLPTLQVQASRYESSAAYATAREVLLAAIGTDAEGDPMPDGERLVALLAAERPEMVGLAPLLADVLPVVVPPTAESAAIEPEFRPARTAEVVTALLGAVLGPAVIVLEDFHWVDDTSRQLLIRLARSCTDRGWVLVFVRRHDPLADISGVPDLVELPLEPLPDGAVRNLAAAAAWPETLTDPALAAVLERADGNPLFAIELAGFTASGDEGPLPETIETLITTRIDELPPRSRLILRIAAALGSEFDERLAVDLLGREVPDFAAGEFTVLMEYVVRSGPDRLGFVHTLHRDVAYEGLPFGVRRSLHATIGALLEDRVAAGELVEPGVLGLHFSVAEIHDKTWHYATAAGHRADLRYANAESIDAFQRAIAAGRHLRNLTADERFEISEAFGRVLNRAGRYEESLAAFDRAQRYAADDVGYATAARGKANCLADLGQFQRALRWSGRGAARLAADDSQLATGLRAGLLRWEAGVLTRLNDWQGARERAEESLTLARRCGAELEEAHACDLLAMMSDMVEVPDAEANADRALELFEGLGNPQGVASVWNNRGVHRYFEGRWVEAREAYLKAVNAFDRSGDDARAEIGRNNLAEILSDQGHLEEARQLFEHARRSWQLSGFGVGVALTSINLGRLAHRDGDETTALTLLDDGLRRFDELGMPEFVAEANLRLAECHLAAGRLDEVEERIVAVGEAIADSTPRPGLGAALDLLRAGAAATEHDDDRAGSFVAAAVSSARSDGAGFELATALSAARSLDLAGSGAADGRSGRPRGWADGAEAELIDLVDRLGLVTLPGVPGIGA